MNTNPTQSTKVQVTLKLTAEAKNTMLDNEYCSARGMGAFLSQLVMDYHAKRTRQLTQAEIAQELHRLASLLEVRERHEFY